MRKLTHTLTGALRALRKEMPTLLALLAIATLPIPALAAGFDVPFITEFGCQVVQWLKGPLAVLIFILTVVAALVIGMITRMDWGKIITVCVIFGLVVAIGGILSNSSYVQNVAGMGACLQ